MEKIKWLQSNFNKIVENMGKSEHSYDKNNINIFHMEGNVLIHTKMVYEEAKKLTNKEEILLAALLHDIGKPMAREVIEERKIVRFFCHENISTVLAIEILLKYKNDINKDLDIKRTLELINWHSDFHSIEEGKLSKKQEKMLIEKYENEELFHDMYIMSLADNLGRVTETTTKQNTLKRFQFIKNQYEELKNKEKVTINKKQKITLLVGLPNSGKSTYLKKLKTNNNTIILSMDEILLEKYKGLTYNKAWEKANENKNEGYKEIEKTFKEKLSKALKDKKDIIIDKTNLSKKSRNRLLSSLKKDIKKEAILFLTSLKTINERNKKRNLKENKYINNNTLNNFIKIYTMPDKSEFDNIKVIIEDYTNSIQKDKIQDKNKKIKI